MKNLVIVSALAFMGFTFSAFTLTPEKGDNQMAAETNNKSTYITSEIQTTIEWYGSKITGGAHEGTMAVSEKELEFKGDKLTGGAFTVDMNSIQSTDLSGGSKAKLEGHLKSDDFFGVEDHPTATFVITDVKDHDKAGHYHVTGDITIKGITKKISFPVEISWKGSNAIAKADIVVDRTEFDVRFGSGKFFDGLGDRAIKDEFTLSVNLVAEVK